MNKLIIFSALVALCFAVDIAQLKQDFPEDMAKFQTYISKENLAKTFKSDQDVYNRFLSFQEELRTQERSLITFKDKECEKFAMENGAAVFGEDHKYLKNVGVMIVQKQVDEVKQHFQSNSLIFDKFNQCINTIEQDQVIHINDPPAPKNVSDAHYQWHLKRITQRSLPLNAHMRKIEKRAESHVYIVDSGIDAAHIQLKMYVGEGAEANKAFTSDYCCETSYDALCDCNNHGTHCAGLVASEVAGYNQFTTLHSAKVFNMFGSASWNTILEAMDWTMETHMRYYKNTVGVVSMSLGGGYTAALNQAAKNLYEGGLFVVVAAGNSNKDACTGSPSSEPTAFTVGSSSIDDSRSYFSEYGECVDTFAPGEQIYSTVAGNAYAYLSGTSMATPLAAGLASYLATEMNTTDPAEIKFIFQCLATQNAVTDAKSTMNILPYDDLSEFNPNNSWCASQLKENPHYKRFLA